MNAQTGTQPTTLTTTSMHPNPQSSDQARSGRRRGLVTSLIAGLLATLSLLVAAPAGAYTTTSKSGIAVNPVIYQVQGAHKDVGQPVTGPMWKQWIYQSGPVVYRVAGSGTQSVRVAYTVDRWNGSSWVPRHTLTGNVSIGSAYTSAKAPNLSVLPSDGAGYYRVRLAMTWTSPIGAVIGSMNVTMSDTGDYTCTTTRTCSVGPGYVYLGA